MKNIFLIICLFLASMIVSCSSDDPTFRVPEVPGENLKNDEVHFVFSATRSDNQVVIDVKTAGDIYVNWGDDDQLHKYHPTDEISYVYPAEAKEYIISLQSSGISELDLSKRESRNIVSVYFGNCDKLNNINISPDNKLTNIDIRNCPLLTTATMKVNSRNFDLNGLSNVEHLNIYLNVATSIDIDGFPNLRALSIYPSYPQTLVFDHIRIKNTPKLEYYYMYGGYELNMASIILPHVNELDIDAPALKEINIQNLSVEIGVDFSKLENLKKLRLAVFKCGKDFRLNTGLESLELINSNYNLANPPLFWEIDNLDLTPLKKLQKVIINYQPGFGSVHANELNNLDYFFLENSNAITDLKLINLPYLKKITCWRNSSLKSLNLENLPEIETMEIWNNPMLSELTVKNLPKVNSVNLSTNNIGSETLKACFENFSPTYSGEAARSYFIEGNPGNTPEVHDFIKSLGKWKTNSDNQDNILLMCEPKNYQEQTFYIRAK